MKSSYGDCLRVTLFGQSHAPAVGVTIEGLPAGERIDTDELGRFLARRAPGRHSWSTARSEADVPEFLCGLHNGCTCGAPLTAIIRNTDTRPGDYSTVVRVPRPGHADYTAQLKYGGFQDASGGGHFSGRLTAPLCIAGGICMQLLRRQGISVIARIAAIAGITDEGELTRDLGDAPFATVSAERGLAMQQAIADAQARGDSVGGIVECAVLGLPGGLGDPLFGGMESRISAIVFGIPAVKGVEFGAGFASAALRGSENNDPLVLRDGQVVTESNRCGGILGGITNGMPLVLRAAFKPTPSISQPQQSVDLESRTPAVLTLGGRHDPCVVPRAVAPTQAAVAIAVTDALLARRTEMR